MDFWFRPHVFFRQLATAVNTNEKAEVENFYVNSLWLGSFIIVLIASYPLSLWWQFVYPQYSWLHHYIAYFIAAIGVAIVYALISYYGLKGMTASRNEPGWIMYNYQALFGHAYVTAVLLFVFIPLALFIPLTEWLFPGPYVEAITSPILLVILRLFPKFFVAQAMHEKNQPEIENSSD